ncbi:LysR family transcriptional regulator [Pseudomonas sp. M47T1]|uniref:LysR family transcriptional regulator n=1 Tax=Pseudomonas sp. M47T1 TaxID=1179778 RepID=UPI0002606B7B|nr:LysR family transcriptional regulator [Pseudomonas sp. M47T1]
MSLSNLAALRFFNVAAQTQSFVKAAQLLNVTHGAVSRQVRLLEQSLGLELFERRNRAIFLNAAGHTLYQATAPLFEQLHRTIDQLKQHVQDGVRVVS